jgi:hypothetical protein
MAHPQTKNEEHPFHDLLIVVHRGAVRKLKKLMRPASLFSFAACDSHTRDRLKRVAVVGGEIS